MFLIAGMFLIGCAINLFFTLEQPEVVTALWWIPMLAGTVLGAVQGAKNEKKMERDRAYRKRVIKYSPWTKMTDPGVTERPDMLTSMGSGAIKGLTVGAMMKKAAAPTPDKAPQTTVQPKTWEESAANEVDAPVREEGTIGPENASYYGYKAPQTKSAGALGPKLVGQETPKFEQMPVWSPMAKANQQHMQGSGSPMGGISQSDLAQLSPTEKQRLKKMLEESNTL